MTASPLPLDTLARDLRGELLTGIYDRGRYATDASIYQMMPLGVVVPQHAEDVEAALDFARRHGVPVLARGGGTSQCGQAVSRGLVIDYTKYLNDIVYLDMETLRCRVLPGVVLDQLNRMLKPRGVWFPVDVSTASRATIGGMTANNSCGSRSLRYGLMRDNVDAIDAILADGARRRFGSLSLAEAERDAFWQPLVALGKRERDEIRARFPDVLRRVGGYNIDALVPGLHRPAAGVPGDADNGSINSAHLLVGSEGTLALSEAIDLHLSPLPAHKLLGVLHFPSFHEAMDAAQHIVALEPVAVELIDRTMIELSMDIPMFRPVVKRFVRGEPEALLLVEFAEEDPAENRRRLTALGDLMGDLGFHWDHPPKKRGGMVEAVDPGFQAEIFEVRKAGLNIMMSMKEERKPVSFVEDCAVALKDLAEYTERLTGIFRKHGTMGTWYAHASVGCLHVRPVLNLRLDQDVKAMRAIAEEAFDMVLEYRGSHSGEHGDGLVRSEFHHRMFGARMVDSFAEVKGLLDPGG
ncbi:MAG: FAD-binding oxidoreductase, partial [Gammaproteobacteria bacterium]|nr:FAD-binding oxidoreductase [Gammaproteobacteria bacterium]